MAVVVRRLGQPGDLGWVVMAHGELYAAEYGWDASFEALVLQIVAEFAATRDRDGVEAWIAEVDGERAASIFCMPGDSGEAKLRILLVDPRFRGRGLGRLLVDRCLDFARSAGYRRVVLWTNSVLVSARRIYEAAGFRLVDESPHRSFGHDLVGQAWAPDL